MAKKRKKVRIDDEIDAEDTTGMEESRSESVSSNQHETHEISHTDVSSNDTGEGDSGSEGSSGGGGPELIEDGFDVATHGGGTLESVEEFGEYRALTEGFNPENIEVTEELSNLPRSCDLEFDSPESVCGRDDRIRISGTSRIPWRMICQLIITRNDGSSSRCTGWLIGPGTVMTAGHCVYSHSAGGWAKKIEVIPGMNASSRPFGSTTSSNFRSVTGWTKDAKITHDYGCIILNNKIGRRTGWFGFANLSDASLRNLLVNNSGYPGDKPFGTQWFNAGRVTKVTTRRLHYMLDTAGGQSGSPTWRLKDNKRHAVGIHAYGGCPNKSTRISKPVFDNMKKWKLLGS